MTLNSDSLYDKVIFGINFPDLGWHIQTLTGHSNGHSHLATHFVNVFSTVPLLGCLLQSNRPGPLGPP